MSCSRLQSEPSSGLTNLLPIHLTAFRSGSLLGKYDKRLKTYRMIGFSLLTDKAPAKQTINAIFDSGNYTEKFEQDLVESDKKIVISSPDICADKVYRFLDIIKERQEKGGTVSVITTDPQSTMYEKSTECSELIRMMENSGISVICKDYIEEHFAVIDDLIVWHGGMNLLGKEDAWDNLGAVAILKFFSRAQPIFHAFFCE